MGEEIKKDFEKNAVLLTRTKVYNDYVICKKRIGGIEPESFFEQWQKDFLFNVDEDFKRSVWKGFLELLYFYKEYGPTNR